MYLQLIQLAGVSTLCGQEALYLIIACMGKINKVVGEKRERRVDGCMFSGQEGAQSEDGVSRWTSVVGHSRQCVF